MLRRALKLRPDNGYIQDSWGYYLFVRGRISEAIVELEKAAKLKPDEPVILHHLGDAYLKSNLWHKAREQYERALRFTQDSPLKGTLQNKNETGDRRIASAGGDTGVRKPAATAKKDEEPAEE